jgi:hypothetical protein
MRKIFLLITILICHWGYSQVAGLVTRVKKDPENVKYSKIGLSLETGHISSRSTFSNPISSEFYHPKISIGNKISLNLGVFLIAQKFHHNDSLFPTNRTRTLGFDYTFYTSNQKFFINSGVTFHFRQFFSSGPGQFLLPYTGDLPLFQAISPNIKMGYNLTDANNIFLGAALRNNRTIFYNQSLIYLGIDFKFRKNEKEKVKTEGT